MIFSLLCTSVCSQQNFISKCLESKEATITSLNEDGEKLIASEHPGKNVIEVPVCPSAQLDECLMFECSPIMCSLTLFSGSYGGSPRRLEGVPEPANL